MVIVRFTRRVLPLVLPRSTVYAITSLYYGSVLLSSQVFSTFDVIRMQKKGEKRKGEHRITLLEETRAAKFDVRIEDSLLRMV